MSQLSKDQQLAEARAALRWAIEHGVTLSYGIFYDGHMRVDVPQSIARELRHAKTVLTRKFK